MKKGKMIEHRRQSFLKVLRNIGLIMAGVGTVLRAYLHLCRFLQLW